MVQYSSVVWATFTVETDKIAHRTTPTRAVPLGENGTQVWICASYEADLLPGHVQWGSI